MLCGKCAVWKGRKESLSLGPADRDADGDMRGREVAGLKSRAWLKDEEDENGMGWIWDREVGEMIEDEKEEGVKAVNSVEDDEWRLKRFEQLKDEGEMIGEAEIEVDESDYDGYDDYDEFDDISSEGTENVAWGEYQRRSA